MAEQIITEATVSLDVDAGNDPAAVITYLADSLGAAGRTKSASCSLHILNDGQQRPSAWYFPQDAGGDPTLFVEHHGAGNRARVQGAGEGQQCSARRVEQRGVGHLVPPLERQALVLRGVSGVDADERHLLLGQFAGGVAEQREPVGGDLRGVVETQRVARTRRGHADFPEEAAHRGARFGGEILVGQRQNEEMTALSRASNAQNDEVKKISAWAAIGFAPTTIASIYGMNFKHMPELHWLLGYPFAVLLMVMAAGILYVLFKRRGWI